MSKLLEQKCPKCGAMTHFDPNTQMLVCDYCDSKFPFSVEKVKAEPLTKDFDFEHFRKGYEQPDAAKLPIYNCKSCGAELIAPAEQISLTCPYCRNHVVLTDKVTGDLRPNGIIPFQFTADELPERLRRFYQDKKMLPRSFFSQAAMAGVTGVYVPFWLFSGCVEGEGSFVVSRSTSRKEGNYKVTETSYYEITRDVHAYFNDVPVDASKRISDELMDSLEPFDTSQVRPFDPSYLAGFIADRFDSPTKDVERRAKTRIENTAGAMLTGKISGYESAVRSGGPLKTTLTAQYYLLPVYLFKLKFAGYEYPFAVNGQTGKIVGNLPSYTTLKTQYYLKRFIPTVVGILGAFILKYFMGG